MSVQLFSCVIVFLPVGASDMMDVFRSAMFSRLCVVAILLGCAVKSVSSLTMQRLVFNLLYDCRASCLRVLLHLHCRTSHGCVY